MKMNNTKLWVLAAIFCICGACKPLVASAVMTILLLRHSSPPYITEITEAPWYIQNDTRLAAPLLNTPFTHCEIGVLMRKGQDDLLQMVNKTIRQMKSDDTLRSLHEKYRLIYAY